MRIVRLCVAMAVLIGLVHIARAADDAKDKSKVDPVDFHKLQELLPETFGGFKRTSATGRLIKTEKSVLAEAKGEYRKADESGIIITFTDYIADPAARDDASNWTSMDIDQENGGGFSRTFKLAGHPAWEQYQQDSRTGQLQVFVADRYLILVIANKLTPEQVKKLPETLPVAKLADLK